MAFHSVIHAIRPELVDMDIVRKRSNRENLEEAFSVAENELGIPRLLDPEGTDTACFTLKSLQFPLRSTALTYKIAPWYYHCFWTWFYGNPMGMFFRYGNIMTSFK